MISYNRYIFEVPEKDAFKRGDLYFEAKFGSEHDNMIHYGKLVEKPKNAKLKIKKGEIVYFSHLAKNFDSRIEKDGKVYYCIDSGFAEGQHDLSQILLCTTDRPLGNVTIVERIEEPEENYKVGSIFLKPKPDTLENEYRVVMSNKFGVGTHIIIVEGADYDFEDKDHKEMIAVQDENIVASIHNDELVPYGNFAIVEPDDDRSDEDFAERNGVLVEKRRVLTGRGKWGERKILYHKIESNTFEFKKMPFVGVEKEDIYYICD